MSCNNNDILWEHIAETVNSFWTIDNREDLKKDCIEYCFENYDFISYGDHKGVYSTGKTILDLSFKFLLERSHDILSEQQLEEMSGYYSKDENY
tara:strand:- start:879 stop:1160 length:282 start_codon:yes stop_codon:yes gene_type:complete